MLSKDPVHDFIERVQWLHEPEYGDFKRKLGNYIMRLEEQCSDPKTHRALSELKTRVIYRPSGDVEQARRLAIETAARLKT